MSQISSWLKVSDFSVSPRSKYFFFPFWGTFIQLGCLLGQGLGLGLGPGLDNSIKCIIFLIAFVVQFWQISFVMSLVRAGLLLSLIIMLSSTSAMIPFAPALEEGISEILMFSHHRNHGRLIGTYSLLWLDQTGICQIP